MKQTQAYNNVVATAAMAERRRLLTLVSNKFTVTAAATAWGVPDTRNLISRMTKAGLIVKVSRGVYQKGE